MRQRDRIPAPTGARVIVQRVCPDPTQGELVREIRDVVTGDLLWFTVRTINNIDDWTREIVETDYFVDEGWALERAGSWTAETIAQWKANRGRPVGVKWQAHRDRS